jgi:3-hydroxyacyl-[acyl-carrier protein] dehydratase/trans-2-decenoyl-[acyl-carrier protein] isomerase
VAIPKKTSYSKREILSYSFDDGKTRRRLPAPPFLMVDRVKEISPTGGRWNRGYLVAEKDILYDEWYFQCHFKGDPVMPGVLGVDALLQLTGFYLMHLGHDGCGRALAGSFRFNGQVRPDSRLLVYRLDFRKIVAHPQPTAFAEGEAIIHGENGPVGDKPAIVMKNIMVALFPNLPAYPYP